ncbi:ATP-binding protein [Nonomuraea sp. NPDC047897]|uniref:ATP-binding protein n=1 Tax=Nonomuraea sp. NPDC047897 TaxID=3364346 RepID=UPI00371B404A
MCRRAVAADVVRGRIAVLRGAVAAHAAGAGLTGRRLEDFVLAVNEIATNVVLYGGGRGRLRLWAHDDRLWCEVTDEEPGLPPEWTRPARTPSRHDPGGRGLWLTRLLCDHLTIVSTPGGTSVTLSARTG